MTSLSYYITLFTVFILAVVLQVSTAQSSNAVLSPSFPQTDQFSQFSFANREDFQIRAVPTTQSQQVDGQLSDPDIDFGCVWLVFPYTTSSANLGIGFSCSSLSDALTLPPSNWTFSIDWDDALAIDFQKDIYIKRDLTWYDEQTADQMSLSDIQYEKLVTTTDNQTNATIHSLEVTFETNITTLNPTLGLWFIYTPTKPLSKYTILSAQLNISTIGSLDIGTFENQASVVQPFSPRAMELEYNGKALYWNQTIPVNSSSSSSLLQLDLDVSDAPLLNYLQPFSLQYPQVNSSLSNLYLHIFVLGLANNLGTVGFYSPRDDPATYPSSNDTISPCRTSSGDLYQFPVASLSFSYLIIKVPQLPVDQNITLDIICPDVYLNTMAPNITSSDITPVYFETSVRNTVDDNPMVFPLYLMQDIKLVSNKAGRNWFDLILSVTIISIAAFIVLMFIYCCCCNKRNSPSKSSQSYENMYQPLNY